MTTATSTSPLVRILRLALLVSSLLVSTTPSALILATTSASTAATIAEVWSLSRLSALPLGGLLGVPLLSAILLWTALHCLNELPIPRRYNLFPRALPAVRVVPLLDALKIRARTGRAFGTVFKVVEACIPRQLLAYCSDCAHDAIQLKPTKHASKWGLPRSILVQERKKKPIFSSSEATFFLQFLNDKSFDWRHVEGSRKLSTLYISTERISSCHRLVRSGSYILARGSPTSELMSKTHCS